MSQIPASSTEQFKSSFQIHELGESAFGMASVEHGLALSNQVSHLYRNHSQGPCLANTQECIVLMGDRLIYRWLNGELHAQA